MFEQDGNIRGYVSLIGEDVPALYVDPTAQSQGIGGQLVGHAKSMSSRLEREVFSESTRGVSFYKREGFVELGRRGDDLVLNCW